MNKINRNFSGIHGVVLYSTVSRSVELEFGIFEGRFDMYFHNSVSTDIGKFSTVLSFTTVITKLLQNLHINRLGTYLVNFFPYEFRKHSADTKYQTKD